MFLYKKKNCSHRNIHHEDIKTWEVYKTHKTSETIQIYVHMTG